jgi:hypothetical protein
MKRIIEFFEDSWPGVLLACLLLACLLLAVTFFVVDCAGGK